MKVPLVEQQRIIEEANSVLMMELRSALQAFWHATRTLLRWQKLNAREDYHWALVGLRVICHRASATLR